LLGGATTAGRTKTIGAKLLRLVERRSRGQWWAHLVWAGFYSLFTLVMLGSFGARGWADLLRAWPFFIPLGVVVLQWIRPTILGWALLGLPGAVYSVGAVVQIVLDSLGPHPLWRGNPGDFILGSITLVLTIAILAGLMYAGWPRRGVAPSAP